ncbi:polysaccharide pyruvyl transferase family protein [Bacillus sp. USDA818B3_A]|uniref:polysaccharide pyruvyl transferase family protein n=1 Tax=Bacillus sp. USDA818B3_A TaxID=2698834 RepID=UPI001370C7EF|nr:polysaccharide pyruvyl transferase family protein [Bacillus sp. USDA818B3_A]
MNYETVPAKVKEKYYKISLFEPSISSENIGDHIIQDYCMSICKDIFGESMYVSIPTRSKLTKRNYSHIKSSDFSLVFGTNLLASNMRKRKQWDIDFKDTKYINNAVLFGVGWWQYQESPDWYTRVLLKKILSNNLMHSVRDSYTENKLKSIGIKNVVNTACPTMWNLTPEFCSTIPENKSKNVVTTLTNYNKNPESDKAFLEVLLKNYDGVYVWLQAVEDYNYTKSLVSDSKIHFVAPTLSEYDEILKDNDIEYVGTRLHGGIRALNNHKRSIILAVDNRATEISKDTNLMVLQRDEDHLKLETIINSDFKTSIVLPQENINKWKSQFVNIM